MVLSGVTKEVNPYSFGDGRRVTSHLFRENGDSTSLAGMTL